MKINLQLIHFSLKSTVYQKFLLWFLVVVPIFSFAVDPSEKNLGSPPQADNSAVIYITAGSVLVGAENIHHAKIVEVQAVEEKVVKQNKQSKQDLSQNIKEAVSQKKEIEIKRKKAVSKHLSEIVLVAQSNFSTPNSNIVPGSFPTSKSTLLPTNAHSKFILKHSPEFQVEPQFSRQIKGQFYTSNFFVLNFNSQFFSLRAPPSFI